MPTQASTRAQRAVPRRTRRTERTKRTPGAHDVTAIVGAALCLALFSAAFSASAAPTTFTDRTQFLSALPGPATALEFENTPAETAIPDGSALEGITFDYDYGGVNLLVSDAYVTTSTDRFLGTDDVDVLQDGDDFFLSFPPSYAIGIALLTADNLEDDDIRLDAAGASATIVAADLIDSLPPTTNVYFLGIVDPVAPFTSATISTVGGGFFLFNVDDIVTVPEPTLRQTLPAALVWLGVWRMARRRERRC